MGTQRTRAKAKRKTEAARGNERIQQLMEAFSEIPRTLVVKCDLLREGIKPNATSHRVGRWALPDAHWYFEYDKEDTHTKEDTAGGYTLSPLVGHFPDGVSWMFMLNSRSPYEISYEGYGRYRLYRDEEPIEEVTFPARPAWYDRKTSSGKPMASVIAQRGEDNLWLAALTYCEYFKDGGGCRYCNINPSESTKESLGMERLTAKRDRDIFETMTTACHEHKQRSIGISGGVLLNSSKEADNYARIVKIVKRAMKDVGYEVPILVNCQALAAEDQMKLKEAGTSIRNSNLEVWDPRLFELICPGKAKYVGRERWMERLLETVEIFGEGRVSSSFVLGVELAHPDGFKTEDEAAESFLEGCEWMLTHRIFPSGALFRPAPGTMFEGMDPPRTEYFLRMELARYNLAVNYKMVPKPGKPSNGPGVAIHPDFPHVTLRGKPVAGPTPGAGSSEGVC